MTDLSKATPEELEQFNKDLLEATAGKNLQLGAWQEIENNLKEALAQKIANRLGEDYAHGKRAKSKSE